MVLLSSQSVTTHKQAHKIKHQIIIHFKSKILTTTKSHTGKQEEPIPAPPQSVANSASRSDAGSTHSEHHTRGTVAHLENLYLSGGLWVIGFTIKRGQ